MARDNFSRTLKAAKRIRAGLGERRADPDRRLRLRDRRARPHQRREERDGDDLPGAAHRPWLHRGVGKRDVPAASSSG